MTCRCPVMYSLYGALIGCFMIIALCTTSNRPVSKTIAMADIVNLTDESLSSVTLQDGRVRHCLTGNTVGRVPTMAVSLIESAITGVQDSPETGDQRRASFRKVFRDRLWGDKVDENYKGPVASGPGSTLHSAMEIILVLHTLIDQYKRLYQVPRVRLLDVACGDMLWMSRFLSTRDDVDFTGVDIVPDLISSHRKNFAMHSTWTFAVADFAAGELGTFPLQNDSFHLIVCRQMLQHLFHSDALRVLISLSSIAKNRQLPVYLIASSFSAVPTNIDLGDTSSYRFRQLNLEIPPISLEPPLCVVRDGLSDSPFHMLGLWKLPLRQVTGCRNSVDLDAVGFPLKFYSCIDWSVV